MGIASRRSILFLQIVGWHSSKLLWGCSKKKYYAEVAQLVERNLAKVEVAGPNPVFRSNAVKRLADECRGCK